jgi:probable H4MPT-linked C1 transfer pathway protein
MSEKFVIGWDVGGANLKAVLLNSEGSLLQVIQVSCPLWRGLNELGIAIDEILNKLSVPSATHAITMTGELVDLFDNRQVGVTEISCMMNAKLTGKKLFYTGALDSNFAGFVTIDKVDIHWQHIASANWLASASFLAKYVEQGLLIDIGSTTSDFILIEHYQPVCSGLTDAARMQTEELVYTGVIRTPLMSVTQKIKFENTVTSLAAEFFATTADVYRLTGDLTPEDDMADTADGKDKSSHSTLQRIARMIGHDADDAPLVAWNALAVEFKMKQVARLQDVAIKHIKRIENNQNVKIIGVGAGSFIARHIAENMNMQYLEVADIIQNTLPATGNDVKHWASVCFPACAVANLAIHKN